MAQDWAQSAYAKHAAAEQLVARTSGEHVRQRTLAGAVRAHDGVDFAWAHGEVDALEDLLAVYAGGEVFDFD